MLCEHFLPQVRGGVETYTWFVSRELVRRGHDVQVFTMSQNHVGEDDAAPFPIHRLTYKDYLSSRIAGDFDIVNVQNFSRFTFPFVVKFQNNAKVVLTCHGALLGPSFERTVSLKFSLKYVYDAAFDFAVSPLLLQRAARIIALTKMEKDYLLKNFPLGSSKVALAPAVLASDAFSTPCRHDLDLPKDFILTVGRITERKSLDHVIRALARLSGIHFVIAGQDQGALRELLHLAGERGVLDRVHYLGIVDDEAKRYLLSKCSLFVLPSRWELLSTAALEAMAQSAVVVATDVGSVKEVIVNGSNGFLYTYGDLGSLSQIVEKVINDRTSRKEIGRRAFELAWKKFRVEVVAETIESIYHDVTRGFS